MEPKIGVLLCQCGGNVSDVVNLDSVKENLNKMAGIVVETDTHWCSAPAAERIRELLKAQNINRVVVAACTPRMHQEHFRTVVEVGGLNPYLLERVNVREQCSWVHHNDPEQATKKATSLIRGAVERAKELVELSPIREKVSRDVVVIGGGIAGIIASLELAAADYRVTLVEKSPSIGGRMSKFAKVFPSFDCAACILTPKMVAASTHQNIELLTYSEVREVNGTPGNYEVTIVKKPKYVDEEKCTGCGLCVEACSVKVPNEFNEGIDQRRAIYVVYPQAVPRIPVVDEKACLAIKYGKPDKSVCMKCVEVCKADAIDFEMKPETLSVRAGAIITAVGAQTFDASLKPEFGYGWYKNVITNVEFERYTNVDGPTEGTLINPLTGKPPKAVVFIQCVGSRDSKFYEYCCRVGCTVALKHALFIKEFVNKNIDVYVCYNDLRTVGKGFEEFYKRARGAGIEFVRGIPSEVKQKQDGTLTFNVFDVTTNKLYEINADLVVLTAGLVPSPDVEGSGKTLRIPIGPDGFLLEAHEKLRPVEASKGGIFLVGACSGPKDIRDTTSDAMAAASKAVGFLAAGEIIKEPVLAYLSDPGKCDGCGDCVEVCLQGALSVGDGGLRINSVMCNGCGLCIPACSKRALDLHNYTERQLRSQIKGILEEYPEERKILVFVEGEEAYTALDTAGLNRATYPASTRVVRLPSTWRLSFDDILYAFANGAQGVVLLEATREGPFGEVHLRAVDRGIKEFRMKLKDYGISSGRMQISNVFLPQWSKVVSAFEILDRRVEGEGPIDPKVRGQIEQKILAP